MVFSIKLFNCLRGDDHGVKLKAESEVLKVELGYLVLVANQKHVRSLLYTCS
jgi:hypothetical protein